MGSAALLVLGIDIGSLGVRNLRLDVWRAPIDNDAIPGVAEAWKEAGLHRVQHRVVSAGAADGAWEIVTRTAPPALQWGLVATWRWTHGQDGSVVLDLSVEPDGQYPATLPRLGIAFDLPTRLERRVVRRRTGRGVRRHPRGCCRR